MPNHHLFCVRLVVLFSFTLCVRGADTRTTDALTPHRHIELFDGHSLAGWVFVGKEPALDAASIWSGKDGVVQCLGKPNGYARTTLSYRDYVLHFEWRWPGAKGGNSGVFVHLNPPDKVWPTCLEVQLKAEDAGSVRANGGAKVNELVSNAKDPINVSRRVPGVEKPVGEWNQAEVVCRDHRVTIYINGILQNEVTGATVSSGTIGLQAEGAPVEFRNVVLDPLPQP